jgi:imidazoleglycerol phosphate synthase glutamine amidotransferase subunit HisH
LSPAARTGAKLAANLAPHPYLYFAHSYYAPLNDATAATCQYTRALHGGARNQKHLRRAVSSGEIGPLGLKIVRNFVEL